MALVTLPAKFGFTSVDLRLQRAGSTLRSRYTGKAQRTIFPFAVWFFEGTLVEYPEPEASAVRAFLVGLEGIKNTFKLPVPGAATPSTGAVNANIVTDVAIAARVTSIQLRNLGVGQLVLNPGDYFTVADELKVATSTLQGNGAGIGSVSFQPPMRKAISTDPIDDLNRKVYINNPYCLMHAAEDDVASWKLSAPVKHGVTLEAVEAI